MSTTGHETEAINVQGLKASLKKGGNKGIYNEAICSTAGATAAKVTNTTPLSFSLVSGAKIIVKFTYTISVANATLQVGSTAAKPIYLKGAALAANVVKAGTSLLLAYDGTAFNIIGGIGGNETDISYDTTNKKLTKTIDEVQSDVVTAATIVEDGGGIEVEIGETAPTEDVKLFVDEDADPAVTLDVYTRQETDVMIADTVHLSEQTLTEAQKAQARNNIGVVGSEVLEYTRKTDFDLAVLKQAVADGNLEKYGLKVGDEKTINGHTYVIAGLNPMKGTSTPYRLTQNHVGLIVIPHTITKWNASGNAYTGADGRGAGYLNSDLHYYLKNTLLPLVNTDLGASNLIGHSKRLTSGINQIGYNRFGDATGCSNNWTWEADCKICALSEVQVYGATVWSSSGYDTGEACRQLEVFQKYSYTEIFGNEYPWLRDVVTAAYAANALLYGYASYGSASADCFVAALILFH